MESGKIQTCSKERTFTKIKNYQTNKWHSFYWFCYHIYAYHLLFSISQISNFWAMEEDLFELPYKTSNNSINSNIKINNPIDSINSNIRIRWHRFDSLSRKECVILFVFIFKTYFVKIMSESNFHKKQKQDVSQYIQKGELRNENTRMSAT